MQSLRSPGLVLLARSCGLRALGLTSLGLDSLVIGPPSLADLVQDGLDTNQEP